MRRRDVLASGLGGAALSWLGRGCKAGSGSKPGEPVGPEIPQPVYALTDGRSLYDDFDGAGNLQTYDGQPLAIAGELNSKIWGADYGVEVLGNPSGSPPFSVVDESGRSADSALPGAGRTGRAWRRLLVVGADDSIVETPAGLFRVEKGKVYGEAEPVGAGPRGYVLKVTNLLIFAPKYFIKVRLTNPDILDFPDFKTFSADVMLSSEGSSGGSGAGLDFHTTIPEQPPGKSWWTQILISRPASGSPFIVGLFANYNTGEEFSLNMGPAESDRWYNLREDIVTRQDDPGLAADVIRLDFYINEELMGSLLPADAPILLDSERTGVGPNRALAVFNQEGAPSAVAYFDNVRAVYGDRIG